MISSLHRLNFEVAVQIYDFMLSNYSAVPEQKRCQHSVSRYPVDESYGALHSIVPITEREYRRATGIARSHVSATGGENAADESWRDSLAEAAHVSADYGQRTTKS